MDAVAAIAVGLGTAVGIAVPGLTAVYRFAPMFSKKEERTNSVSISSIDVSESVERAIARLIAPVFQQQTDILERMEQNQQRMQSTLGDNTKALEIFMRLEEQRERMTRRI